MRHRLDPEVIHRCQGWRVDYTKVWIHWREYPMGYGLSVFRVPEPILARVCGKNDQALLNDALKALEDALQNYDKQMDAPDLENNDIDISHADAVREIFSGKFTQGVNGAR